MKTILNLSNNVYGKLTVIKQVDAPVNLKKLTYWLCMCECGNEKVILGTNLKAGKTKSCGCIEHVRFREHSYRKALLSTAKEVFRSNRYNDGNLTFDDFYKLSQMPCHYCNSSVENSHTITNRFISRYNKNKRVSKFAVDNGYFKYNGLDRIDSNLKHNIDNVVTCCTFCNGFKLNLSLSEFYNKIKNLKSNIMPITISKLFIPYSMKDFINKFPDIYRNRQNRLLLEISWIKSRAKTRKLDFNLTKEQRAFLITSPCIYCNSFTSKFNGVDRLDSNKGYTEDNCVSSCKHCNVAKNDRTFNEFSKWIDRVRNFQNNRGLK